MLQAFPQPGKAEKKYWKEAEEEKNPRHFGPISSPAGAGFGGKLPILQNLNSHESATLAVYFAHARCEHEILYRTIISFI